MSKLYKVETGIWAKSHGVFFCLDLYAIVSIGDLNEYGITPDIKLISTCDFAGRDNLSYIPKEKEPDIVKSLQTEGGIIRKIEFEFINDYRSGRLQEPTPDDLETIREHGVEL